MMGSPRFGADLCLLALLASLATAPAAFGDDYPSKPVRLIVPYPPGGGTDLIARPLAERLAAKLGQRFIVDHRGGANGNIGMNLSMICSSLAGSSGKMFSRLDSVRPSVVLTITSPDRDFGKPGFGSTS